MTAIDPPVPSSLDDHLCLIESSRSLEDEKSDVEDTHARTHAEAHADTQRHGQFPKTSDDYVSAVSFVTHSDDMT